MKSALIALVLFVPLAAAGCRSGDPSLPLVENEARYLEDQLYQLEYEYDRKCEELASCRLENDALRQALEEAGEPGLLAPPHRSEPSVDIDLDLGAGHMPLDSAGDSVAEDYDAGDDDAAPQDLQVTSIVLNGRLTGGYDFDGRPGDEGISVVIEPQNASHQYVPLPGKLSVVVLDPAREGSTARVARWDLDRSQTSPLIRRTAMGRGIHLELPWPNQPPTNRELQVFVRYTTADNRELEDQRDILVDIPGAISSRWTPAGDGSLAETTPPPEPASDYPNVADRRAEAPGGNLESGDVPAVGAPPMMGETSPGLQIDVPLPGDDPEPSRDRRPFWRPFR